jgi:hypothetical protein
MSVSLAFCDVEPAFPVAVSMDDPESSSEGGGSHARLAEIRNQLIAQTFEKLTTDVVLASTDPDDLLARLDDTLLDPDFRALRRDLNEFVSLDVVRRTLGEGHVPTSIVAAAGAKFARELHTAVRLQNALTRVLLILIAQTEQEPTSVAKAASRDERIRVRRLDRPPIESNAPVEAKRAMWGLERVGGAIWALQSPEVHSTAPWVTHTLFNIWIESAKDALRLFANMPGADVPTDLVPMNERLDLSKLVQAHNEAERGYKERLQAARASGADVYPRLNGPSRD